ncbi:MAG: DUF58 domain-containing protein [Chloroflexi bacterium]|nr:DUF58 domain-containing protein [Chloroflexota bacterium]
MQRPPRFGSRAIVLHGQSAGDTLWLVESRGIGLSLLLLAGGVWFGATPVAVTAGLLLGLAVVVRGWSWLALLAVRCEVRFREDRAFPDDDLDLLLSVSSRGPIPIPWLELDLTVPRGLHVFSTADGEVRGDGRVVHLLATILPFRTIERTTRVRCRQRGYYAVPSVTIVVADPLRLYPRRIEYPVGAEAIVYPRIVPLDKIGLRAELAQGDIRERRVLLTDPTRAVGVREYRPGDPPRSIHWKASARRGALQVKVLERTARLQLALFLDVGSFDHSWLVFRDSLFERAVTATASLAQDVLDRGGQIALGLGGQEPVSLPIAGGMEQHRLVLEALAVVDAKQGRPLASVLAASLWRQPAGTTIVILTADLDDEIGAEILTARRRGHPVALVYFGLDKIEPPDGVAWFDLGRDRNIVSGLAEEARP